MSAQRLEQNGRNSCTAGLRQIGHDRLPGFLPDASGVAPPLPAPERLRFFKGVSRYLI